MTSTPVILSVQNLTTSFRIGSAWRPAVCGISFDIKAGETLAIVGESGSGKSITALSIMRLLPKQNTRVDGAILFDQRSILDLPENEMRHIRGNSIAMIFQEPMTSLNPVLTVGAQIAEALRLHRGLGKVQTQAEVLRLLDKVGIPDSRRRIDDYPHRLSGGMRQRIMIAMALACNPQLLIADEPTTALDVTIQAQILDLIKALQKEANMAVLVITHDMGVVAEIADRTIVMTAGEIVESGNTSNVLSNPTHTYTKTLLAAVPQLGAMDGSSRPMRFPVVDLSTGAVQAPAKPYTPPDSKKENVLEVRNLVTRFDVRSGLFGKVKSRVHAVENVSFSLAAGETLSIVGESGCGKSTTGRSILRLVEAQSGTVTLGGTNILSMQKSELRDARRNIQMIFQDPFASLNPRMTVGALIAEPILAHGLASREDALTKARDLLRAVGLSPDMSERYPHEFSGGQRQRICIARALSLEPHIIVADESVSALDASSKAQVINLMLDLQETLNLSYLFISHDMAVVERISHRVAVMYLGEIVEIGARAEVFGNPQHPYTQRLLAAVPTLNPGQRSVRRELNSDEIRSPVRPASYTPPARKYREVCAGHFVQIPA